MKLPFGKEGRKSSEGYPAPELFATEPHGVGRPLNVADPRLPPGLTLFATYFILGRRQPEDTA